MKKMDLNYVQSFCYDLNKLKPLFVGSYTLPERNREFARFISGILPVSRVALVQVDGKGKCRECTEWFRPGYRQDNLFSLFLEKWLDACIDQLYHGGYLYGDVLNQMIRAADEKAASGFIPIVFPILQEGKIIGLACFGRENALGDWEQQEIDLLEILVLIISISLANQTMFAQQELYSFVLNTLLDSMNANLYITDPRTDEILFMNKSMKKEFGIEHPEGQVCWKVLQRGMEQRCSCCPVEKLLGSPLEKPFCIWEETNSITGNIYENHDSLIRWIDGSMVHLQQSIDVTDMKRLTQAVRMDELTGALNRRAGKDALEQMFAEARKNDETVTVCLCDINGTKEVNELFGHTEGDALLAATAEAIRKQLNGKDLLFRLNGDEFVAAFYGLEQYGAIERLNEILETLKQDGERPYEASFCYGLAEIKACQKSDSTDALVLADEKMYEQKRAYHILKKEKEYRAIVRTTNFDGKTFAFDRDQFYRALVQSTDDYIFIGDMKTNTFLYPEPMVREFGLPGTVVQNAAAFWADKIHPHDKRIFLESNQEVADGRTNMHSVEYRARNKEDEWVWLRCRGYLERDSTGAPALFAGIITNLGRKNKTDHMTGLFNKYEFEKAVKESCQSIHSFGMLILGIDDFKHINDLYDRAFGDEVLRIIAQRIQELLPGYAQVYRLDGDEFGVLINEPDRHELQRVYASLRNVFRRQQECDGKKYYCTLSAGCSRYPEDADNYLDLVKYAEYSLEYAKKNGKNRLSFFDRETLFHKERSLELIELFRESIEHNFQGFELYYQPQVYAVSGQVMGAEALVRWGCEKYGFISPAEFIPLLEQSGLIIPVGKWIFEQAAAQCKEWTGHNPSFTMSINLSYLQVVDQEFIPFMEQTLKKLQLSPANVVVELTESYLARSSGSVKEIFEHIRSLGIKIAMDDFGTGYSSLEILKNSPADIVKIDKTFIKDIRSSSFDATFIRFIVALCHDVGIEVCLEGLETKEEYSIVSHMQLDYIQGYLFGKPVPKKQFCHDFLLNGSNA